MVFKLNCVLSLQDISELKTVVKERATFYKEQQITLQPCMVCLRQGQIIHEYYMVSENVLYKLPSVLKCLEVTFQFHQVFNLQYDKASANMWMFVQRVLYDIKTIYDTRSPAVSQLEKLLFNWVQCELIFARFCCRLI